MHCSLRLIVQTLVFSRSYLHRQVSPPETLLVKGGTTWTRNGWWILSENARLPRNIQGSFTCRKSTTWDKRLYFPSEGRRAEDFFALKNPTASVGFEPANLGTKGQHVTSRPPKLHWGSMDWIDLHQDIGRRRNVVKMAVDCRVSQNTENFLTVCGPVGFSSILLLGVQFSSVHICTVTLTWIQHFNLLTPSGYFTYHQV